jgi:hypothetical protein
MPSLVELRSVVDGRHNNIHPPSARAVHTAKRGVSVYSENERKFFRSVGDAMQLKEIHCREETKTFQLRLTWIFVHVSATQRGRSQLV